MVRKNVAKNQNEIAKEDRRIINSETKLTQFQNSSRLSQQQLNNSDMELS